jgi:uncharacterized hydrophobic protein (TIGR00271 family)
MLHLRVVSPADRTAGVIQALRDHPASFNVSVLRGAALDPAGDLVLCDVAREGANDVVVALQSLGVDEVGSVALSRVDVLVGAAGVQAEARAPGAAGDAAVWEEVDERVRGESSLTASFLLFIVVAALIAAVGLVEDAPILIVGAMVVGPEFGPLAGLSVGVFRRRSALIRMALLTLVTGITVAVVATYLATAVADAFDLVPAEFSPGVQPLTGFVVDPSALSFVVAFLAGIAGTLSLTQARSGALIGVLISVTTIPAIAAMGVSAALGRWDDARGATAQLALNLVALVVAGVSTLAVQEAAWDRLLPPRERRSPAGTRQGDGRPR